jgi:hypothetical protein
MSLPKPWYRKSKKAWYLQVTRSVQKYLGKTKAQADGAYRQWLLEQGEQLPAAKRKRLTVAEIAQEFLDHSKRNNDARTYEFYSYFVVPVRGTIRLRRRSHLPATSLQQMAGRALGLEGGSPQRHHRRQAHVQLGGQRRWPAGRQPSQGHQEAAQEAP